MQQTRPPDNAVVTLAKTSMAPPASSSMWQWQWQTLLQPHTAPPRHQMNLRGSPVGRTQHLPEVPLGGRVNDDDTGTEKTRTPDSPVSPVNRLP